MLDLKRLAIFRTVIRRGSFSAAAIELSYTQPAVSHHIAALEAEVGARLLDRRARGLELTPAGAALLKHIDGILAKVGEAEAELAGVLGQRAPQMRVGAFATASATFVAEAVADYRQGHPDAELSLVEGEAPEDMAQLRGRDIDLGVVFDSVAHPLPIPASTRLKPLFEDPMLLALPADHPLASRPQLGIGDLRDDDWIGGAAPDTPCSLILLDMCSEHGYRPRIAFNSGNYQVVRRLVSAGVGVALVPGLGLQNPEPGVVVRRLTDNPRRRVWLAHRVELFRSPGVDELRRILMSAAAAHAAQASPYRDSL